MSHHIQYRLNEDRVGILNFDREGSSANIFDHDTLGELAAHLDTIEADTELRGLVLVSAKEKIFIAGADINAFSQVEDPEALREIARAGQETFARISDLKIPTVAAIHGQALGGGCEIALACDYRLASDSRDTKIGLPEVTLGILPAWGGSYRLPRLIGLPNALDMILAGKRVAAYPAKKKGLVDQLCPREHFIRIATEWIGKGKPQRKRDWKTSNPLARMIIRSRVRPMLQKKTNGHYPAPFKALEVCLKAVSADRATAFKLEQDALVELLLTDVCQHLVRLFFLQERARKMSVYEGDVAPTDTVGVIGAGVMGAGIAQWSAAHGNRVILKDVNPEALQKGMAAIGKVFTGAVQRHVFTRTEAQAALDRIFPTAVEVPFKDVDIIIEAATENMDLKKKIFAGLDAAAGPDTVLATNTSALSITELAETTSDPGRVVGIHYFNPVHKMQLVEVVRGRQTRPEVLQRALAFVQQSGKLPVVVNDSPGFLVNRILIPYLMEAGALFEAGADPKAIDGAMLDFGMPMGPLRLIDEVGIDVAHHVATFFAETFGDRMPMPESLNQLLEAGLLGRKNGKGFFLYSGKGEPQVNPEALAFVKTAEHRGTSRELLEERMLNKMLVESRMCLEEGVVESADDIDFAMIFGAGFAPFRGGPMQADKQVERTGT